ncbi:hypothetical protein [Alicyclobacillus shizuokensis]|uniref:hypothetical protein n=1 Tax=Alicyclobacillus shizuokensis TaxID=392014 RepID=UPI00082D6C77|nr:hypothetical protein [Alicyclobacillus shizuokensis]
MPSIADIRAHVTHFTEEIRLRAQPRDEVTVAGKITESFSLDQDLHVITIDDFVGAMRVYMSTEMAEHFKDLLVIGNFVVVRGFVNVVTLNRGDKMEQQHSIVAFELRPL